jgi:hypothetical protein
MPTGMSSTLRVILVTAATMGPLACARYEWVPDDELPQCANFHRARSGRSFTIEKASAADSGFLRGRVIQSDNRRPVPGASVTLLAGPPRTSTTDSLGTFTFPGVPAGTYLLRTRRIGEQSRMDTLHVAHGGGATLELPLTPEVLDGPCSGFAALRVRKPWWKLW